MNTFLWHKIFFYMSDQDLLKKCRRLKISPSYRQALQEIVNQLIVSDEPVELEIACQKLHLIGIERYIRLKNYKPSKWANIGLKGACKCECKFSVGRCPHFDLIELMIKHGANDFEDGLISAFTVGCQPIADLMIQKGAKNIENALRSASRNGKYNLVSRFLETVNPESHVYYEQLFKDACYGGDLGTIQLTFSKVDLKNYTNEYYPNEYIDVFWETVLLSAYQGGHRKAVEWCKTMVDPKYSQLRGFMEVMCRYCDFECVKKPCDHYKLVCEMIEEINSKTLDKMALNWCLNSCLDKTCKNRNHRLSNLLIQNGATQCSNCKGRYHPWFLQDPSARKLYDFVSCYIK